MNKIKKIINYIDEYFSFLTRELEFTKTSEEFDKQYFVINFKSKDIRIKIQNYHREIYMYTASVLEPDDEAAVCNVIEYQSRNTKNIIIRNYYHEIKDLEESYRMQIEELSKIVKDNFPLIKEFYDSEHYKQNNKKLTDYVIKRNPELF